MHEWALAESILTAAVEVANKEKIKKIKEINVEIGELQQIAMEAFNLALDEIVKDIDILKDVKININTEKTILKCNNCENEWKFKDIKISEDEGEAIHFIPEVAFVHTRCPKCKGPDFNILKGRGVSISSIKGEK